MTATARHTVTEPGLLESRSLRTGTTPSSSTTCVLMHLMLCILYYQDEDNRLLDLHIQRSLLQTTLAPYHILSDKHDYQGAASRGCTPPPFWWNDLSILAR
jgi:hypothetical protein